MPKMELIITRFKKLENLTVALANGQIVLLQGTGGSGKTSIMESVAFVLYDDSDHIQSIFSSAGCLVELRVLSSGLKVVRRTNPKLLTVTLNDKSYVDAPAQSIIDGIFGSRYIFELCSYATQAPIPNLLQSSSAKERLKYLTALAFQGHQDTPPDQIVKNITKTLKEKKQEFTRQLEAYEEHLAAFKQQLTLRPINQAAKALTLEHTRSRLDKLDDELRTLYPKKATNDVLRQTLSKTRHDLSDALTQLDTTKATEATLTRECESNHNIEEVMSILTSHKTHLQAIHILESRIGSIGVNLDKTSKQRDDIVVKINTLRTTEKELLKKCDEATTSDGHPESLVAARHNIAAQLNSARNVATARAKINGLKDRRTNILHRLNDQRNARGGLRLKCDETKDSSVRLQSLLERKGLLEAQLTRSKASEASRERLAGLKNQHQTVLDRIGTAVDSSKSISQREYYALEQTWGEYNKHHARATSLGIDYDADTVANTIKDVEDYVKSLELYEDWCVYRSHCKELENIPNDLQARITKCREQEAYRKVIASSSLMECPSCGIQLRLLSNGNSHNHTRLETVDSAPLSASSVDDVSELPHLLSQQQAHSKHTHAIATLVSKHHSLPTLYDNTTKPIQPNVIGLCNGSAQNVLSSLRSIKIITKPDVSLELAKMLLERQRIENEMKVYTEANTDTTDTPASISEQLTSLDDDLTVAKSTATAYRNNHIQLMGIEETIRLLEEQLTSIDSSLETSYGECESAEKELAEMKRMVVPITLPSPPTRVGTDDSIEVEVDVLRQYLKVLDEEYTIAQRKTTAYRNAQSQLLSAQETIKFLEDRLHDVAVEAECLNHDMVVARADLTKLSGDERKRIECNKDLLDERVSRSLDRLSVSTVTSRISIVEEELSRCGMILTARKEAAMKLANIRSQLGALSSRIEGLRHTIEDAERAYDDGMDDLVLAREDEYKSYKKLLPDVEYVARMKSQKGELDKENAILGEVRKDVVALSELQKVAIEIQYQRLSQVVSTLNITLAKAAEFIFPFQIGVRFMLHRRVKGASGNHKVKHDINLEVVYEGVVCDPNKYFSFSQKKRLSLLLTIALNNVHYSPLVMLDELMTNMREDELQLCVSAIREFLLKDSDRIVVCAEHKADESDYDSVISL